MARTKAADTKGRETNGKRRESDRKARGQTKKIIKGILGETGKDRMYEEKGEGRRKKGPAGQDKTKTEDKPAGPDGSHYYLLVDPRPGEAPNYDNSALVRCTGTGRSPMRPIDMMDNALYSQHLKDEGTTGSDTETQGAGLGVAVKGRAAGGATRSDTEAQ